MSLGDRRVVGTRNNTDVIQWLPLWRTSKQQWRLQNSNYKMFCPVFKSWNKKKKSWNKKKKSCRDTWLLDSSRLTYIGWCKKTHWVSKRCHSVIFDPKFIKTHKSICKYILLTPLKINQYWQKLAESCYFWHSILVIKDCLLCVPFPSSLQLRLWVTFTLHICLLGYPRDEFLAVIWISICSLVFETGARRANNS